MQELKSFEKEVQDTGGYVLLDFWAEWCGPCRQMTPILEDFEKKLAGINEKEENLSENESLGSILLNLKSEAANFKIYKVNIDSESNAELAGKENISSIPTLIIYKNGKAIARNSGAFLNIMSLAKWVSTAAAT